VRRGGSGRRRLTAGRQHDRARLVSELSASRSAGGRSGGLLAHSAERTRIAGLIDSFFDTGSEVQREERVQREDQSERGRIGQRAGMTPEPLTLSGVILQRSSTTRTTSTVIQRGSTRTS
jgi:hypothetical protein